MWSSDEKAVNNLGEFIADAGTVATLYGSDAPDVAKFTTRLIERWLNAP